MSNRFEKLQQDQRTEKKEAEENRRICDIHLSEFNKYLDLIVPVLTDLKSALPSRFPPLDVIQVPNNLEYTLALCKDTHNEDLFPIQLRDSYQRAKPYISVTFSFADSNHLAQKFVCFSYHEVFHSYRDLDYQIHDRGTWKSHPNSRISCGLSEKDLIDTLTKVVKNY